MTEKTHQPCPFNDCDSSDAFAYNEQTQKGHCFSCGKGYPNSMRLLKDWAMEAYPFTPYYEKEQPMKTITEPLSLKNQSVRGIVEDVLSF